MGKILRDNNVVIRRGGHEYWLVCDLVRRGMVEATRRGRLLDDHSGRSHDRAFRVTPPGPYRAPAT